MTCPYSEILRDRFKHLEGYALGASCPGCKETACQFWKPAGWWDQDKCAMNIFNKGEATA